MFEICLDKSFCFLLQRIFSFTIRKLSNNFRLLQVHIAELLENMFYSIRAISCFMYSDFMQILNYRVIIPPERGFVKFWRKNFCAKAQVFVGACRLRLRPLLMRLTIRRMR